MVLAGSRWHVCTCGVVVATLARFLRSCCVAASSRDIADIRAEERFQRTRAILSPFAENTTREESDGEVARSSREFLPLGGIYIVREIFRVVSPLWHDEKENTERRQWYSPRNCREIWINIKRDGQFLSCCGGYSETSHFYSSSLSFSLSIALTPRKTFANISRGVLLSTGLLFFWICVFLRTKKISTAEYYTKL